MAEKTKMVELTIDGKTARVPAGTNVLEAAKTVGIRIPNFCYHPDLSWEGSCRMCLVTVNGRPKLIPSCSEQVAEGMDVGVDTESAEDARRAQLEFLLINHPLDCPICDQAGECKLQDYYVEHGRYESRMPRRLKVHKKKVVDLGTRIVLDKERCVLCSRCVRFCREVSGSHALQFFTRGVGTEIGTENDGPITGDDYIGNVVDICPVGALTSKDFRFRQRVWFLRSAESVCANCSTGCNIRADHKDGTLYRFVPRRNPELNKSWICDLGRDSYRDLQGDTRLVGGPRMRRAGELVQTTWEEALGEARAILRTVLDDKEGGIAALGTPKASTETLFVFKRFAQELLQTKLIDYRIDGSHDKTAELADKILRRADPNPNNTGARLLDLARADSVEEILKACEAGKVKLLYLLGPELLTRHPNSERVRRALAQVEHVFLHATHDTDSIDQATLVFPDVPHTEIDGTFVNFENRIQKFERAFPPKLGARPSALVMADLANPLGVNLPRGSAATIFDEMAESEVAFKGLKFDAISRFGTILSAAEPVGAR